VIRRLLADLATGSVIAALCAGGAVLGWRIGRPHPPPPAASGLLAAVHAMQSAGCYEFSGRVTIGIEVLNVGGTFSPPDRLQETLQLVGGPPVERLSLGTITYQRGPARWRRVDSAAVVGDPASFSPPLPQPRA
jgi:hypothetical protein